ncbi:MAG: hypothetical protein HKN43_05690 [Rhodothermales bacterium]|nr:hypothetical protein [Rhodothermales bacterium]
MNDTETLVDRIIGQLSYVSDEIDLLGKFVPQIDSAILTEKPIDGEPSILESFQDMVRKQELLAVELGVQAIHTEDEPEADLATVLERFKNGRDLLVDFLRDHPELSQSIKEDNTPLKTRLHKFILDEASQLRSVTVRLHESNLFRL